MAERWQVQTITGVVNLAPQRVVRIRIALQEGRTRRLGSIPYRLTFLAETRDGKTNADGILEETIPEGVDRASLEFERIRVPILICPLPPVDTCEGVQARLNNLGYEPGRMDGRQGPRTTAAIRAFQRDHRRPITGEADAATRAELRRVHGS